MSLIRGAGGSGDGGSLSSAQERVLNLLSYNPATRILNVGATAAFPPGSIIVGQSHISSALKTVSYKAYDGQRSLGIISDYDANGGDSNPHTYTLSEERELMVNDGFADEMIKDYTVNYTTVGNNFTVDFHIRPFEAGTLRARFRLASDVNAVIFDETRVITQDEVDSEQPISFAGDEHVLGNPYFLDAGIDLVVEFSGIKLLGSTPTSGAFNNIPFPYFESHIMPFERVNIALSSEISALEFQMHEMHDRDTIHLRDGSAIKNRAGAFIIWN